MKKLAVFAIFLSALIPLVIAPNLVSYSVGGKTVLIRGLAFVIMGLITLSVFFEKEKEVRVALLDRIIKIAKNPLWIALTINIVLLALSTVFAYDKSFAFFGEPFRTEGFLTIFAFYILSFGMLVVFNKRAWNRYFLYTSIVGSAVLLVEFWQVATGGGDRPESTVGNPIFLASYSLFVIFAATAVFLRGRREAKKSFMYFGAIVVAASVLGIFLTSTRGTIVALAMALVAVLVLAFINGKSIYLKIFSARKTLHYIAGIVLAVIFIFGGAFMSTRHATFWQRVPGLNRLATTSTSEGTSASRIKFAKLSINGFFKDSDTKMLMLGNGWDNYVFFFQSHYDPLIYRFEEKLADHAHNKLVDVLVMSGMLGLISYLAIWFLLAKYSLALVAKNLPLGLAVTFFLVAYFVNNLFSFDVAVTYLGFYSMVAFLVFSQNEHDH